MQSGKILVTRPQADQQQTLDALSVLGIDTVVSPVMDVVRLAFSLPAKDWQGLVVTSRNSLRMLGAEHLEQLRKVPCYCVGGQTRALAESLELSTARSAFPDIAHLSSYLPEMLCRENGPILYLSGKHRSGSLVQTLRACDLEVMLLEVYDMVPRPCLTDAALEAISGGSLDGVLVYSKRTGQLLLSLIEKYRLNEQMKDVTFYCLSSAVAFSFGQKGFRVVVPDSPEEGALLACVKKDHSYLI